MRRALVPLAVALLAACRSQPSPVTATPSGPGVAGLAARPADCAVEFYRTRPPERPYDEIAALRFEGRVYDGPAAAQEALRRSACAVGADAVFVSYDVVPYLTTGVALSYRDLREKHRADAAARRAEADRAAAAREAREAAAREERRGAESARVAAGASPPAEFVLGRTKEAVRPRTTPDRRAAEQDELRAGAVLWMAPRSSGGWRRVWRSGGVWGWLEEWALEPVAPAALPAPAP